MIIDIILIVALFVCIWKEHKSLVELCDLSNELAKMNSVLMKEHELLMTIFSEEVEKRSSND